MSRDLAGRTVIVTGGSHGIGLATAELLAEDGYRVTICGRTRARLDEAKQRIEKRGRECLAIEADVLAPDAADRVVGATLAQWGRVDVLINNVGGGGRWGKENVEETDLEVWREVYEKNAMAAVRFTRLVLPSMRARKWGRVVNIASIYGREGGGRPWFNMAKAAEISMMKTLAKTAYLARDGITFNTVAPGSILIPNTGWAAEAAKPEFQKWADANLPLGRLGTPEEVAAVVRFLCSEAASLVNGACITVDGGESHAF